MTGPARLLFAAAGLCALAGCAPLPPEPDSALLPASAPAQRPEDALREKAASRQLTLARQAREAGDLASAAGHLRVVVLLAPSDAGARRQLQATEDAIRREIAEELREGRAAQRAGEVSRAKEAMLRVIALDPANAEAASVLRELERQAVARVQADRAARARAESLPPVAQAPRSGTDVSNGYDLDQRLEMLRAGDLSSGLRELRAWVDANPDDRASRQRIGGTVADLAREAEAKGQRESALTLYEQAGQLRGESVPEWNARAKALRKTLSEESYTEGMKAYRTDLAVAIRSFETSLRYDPHNLKAATRLREARQAQQKLQQLSREPAR